MSKRALTKRQKETRGATMALGEQANERGARNERRLIEAVQRLIMGRTPWAHGVRAADTGEDRDGIDVVVNTDVGKLFLQAKSSKNAIRNFKRVQRKHRIECVLASDDDDVLMARAEQAMWTLRHEVLTQRTPA